MNRSPYFNLVIFYTVFLLAASIPKSTLTPLFLSWGLDFNALFLGIGIQFLIGIPLILFITKFSSKRAWTIAMVLFIASILVVVRFFSIYQYFLFSVIDGFLLYFFWIFYNIAHFEHTPKHRTGRSSAIMFSIGPVISVFIPIVTGYLAQINQDVIWILTIGTALIGLVLARNQLDFELKYSISEAFNAIGKVRIFIFIEGFWEAILFAVIPVYTLFFIKTPIGYGAYLSYLAILSVVANLFLGHISDKKQKRIIFLYPTTLIVAVLTFLFIPASQNLNLWIVVTGTLSFLMPAFGTLMLSLFIDNQDNLKHSFVGRELVLSIGRVLGIGVTFILFVAHLQNFLFIVLGFVMLSYPAILFYRTKISKKFSYI